MMAGPDRKGRQRKLFSPYNTEKNHKNSNQKISEDNKKLIKDYVASKWNPDAKYLNLEGCTEQLGNIGADFSNNQFVAEILGVIQTNCPEVQTINFANNNISSLRPFTMLHSSAPKLVNLSFSQNKIEVLSELTFLRGFTDSLNELLLTGNPCTSALNIKMYQHHVKTLFPRLVLLDSTQARTVIAFDIPANSARSDIPVGPGSLFLGDGAQKIATEFVRQYFPIYDANRQDLLGAYSNAATFSLTVGKQSHRIPEAYRNSSHNLIANPVHVLPSQAAHATISRLEAKGAKLITTPIDIVYTLGQLPKSRHNVGDFSADVFIVPSNTTTGGSHVLSVSVTGMFTDVDRDMALGFHRVFLLVPEPKDPNWPFKILNDQLSIFDSSKAEKTNPPAPAAAQPMPAQPPPSPQQLAVATQLAQAAGVSVEIAGQALLQTGGNPEAAQQHIQAMKQQQLQQQQQLLMGKVGIL